MINVERNGIDLIPRKGQSPTEESKTGEVFSATPLFNSGESKLIKEIAVSEPRNSEVLKDLREKRDLLQVRLENSLKFSPEEDVEDKLSQIDEELVNWQEAQIEIVLFLKTTGDNKGVEEEDSLSVLVEAVVHEKTKKIILNGFIKEKESLETQFRDLLINFSQSPTKEIYDQAAEVLESWIEIEEEIVLFFQSEEDGVNEEKETNYYKEFVESFVESLERMESVLPKARKPIHSKLQATKTTLKDLEVEFEKTEKGTEKSFSLKDRFIKIRQLFVNWQEQEVEWIDHLKKEGTQEQVATEELTSRSVRGKFRKAVKTLEFEASEPVERWLKDKVGEAPLASLKKLVELFPKSQETVNIYTRVDKALGGVSKNPGLKQIRDMLWSKNSLADIRVENLNGREYKIAGSDPLILVTARYLESLRETKGKSFNSRILKINNMRLMAFSAIDKQNSRVKEKSLCEDQVRRANFLDPSFLIKQIISYADDDNSLRSDLVALVQGHGVLTSEKLVHLVKIMRPWFLKQKMNLAEKEAVITLR